MKYALLLYGSEEGYANLDEDGTKQLYAAHEAFAREFGDRITSGAELQPSTTATVIKDQGEDGLVTDGPYAETAEQLGGLYIVEAGDLDEAIRIGKRVPTIPGDVLEVRPLVE